MSVNRRFDVNANLDIESVENLLLRVHSRKEQRYKCQECGQTFAATKATPFYRLRHQPEVVVQVVTLLA
jgi:transposase-like protein